MTSSHPLPTSCQWFARAVSVLDRRSALRLAWLFLGAVLARDRRTVTSWIRAAKLSGEFHCCYTIVAAAGKETDSIVARLVMQEVRRLTLALDDTLTLRYGPHIQGAGVAAINHVADRGSPPFPALGEFLDALLKIVIEASRIFKL